MKLNTYPAMNEKIKDLLRIGDIQEAPYDFYAAQRIEELEEQLKAEREAHNALRERLKVVVNTFEKDIEQGYKTKDKEYVIDILSVALGVK